MQISLHHETMMWIRLHLLKEGLNDEISHVFLNWMTNYSVMYRIVLCSTALPVVATQSKPTNP